MKQLDEPKGVQCPSFQTCDLTWACTDSQSCYNPDKLRIKDGRQCSLIRKTQKKGQEKNEAGIRCSFIFWSFLSVCDELWSLWLFLVSERTLLHPGVTVTAHTDQRGVHSEWICCEHGKCWSIAGAVCVWVTADLLVLGMIRSKCCVALLHVFTMSRVLGTDGWTSTNIFFLSCSTSTPSTDDGTDSRVRGRTETHLLLVLHVRT